MKAPPLISIVVPLFNEEHSLPELYTRLTQVLKDRFSCYEILFVDDGSRDHSFDIIRRLAAEDDHASGLSLSRNFGHQVALMAGLQHATGETVVTMDADLQHPPELIPLLFAHYQKGFDIVNTRRLDTVGVGVMKKLSSFIFYRLLNFLSDIRVEPAAADFRLMSRKAVDAFTSIPERGRFTRGLVGWMGFKQDIIDYTASPRYAGKTSYTLRKMLRFGMDGITSFSSKPLRISFYTGLFVFLTGIVYAVYAIIQHFMGGTVPGWTSILVSILIIGGVQLLSIGIIGEYIGKIYHETKGRPLYFLKDTTGNRFS